MARRKTQNEYVSQVADVNPNMEVISEYIGDKCTINFRCKKCGFEDSSRADNLFRPILCKNCEGYRNIRYGVNDFYTLFPNFAICMEDQWLAHRIGSRSHKKVWFVCPNCNTRIFTRIVDVARRGLSCPSCSSGRSYPNRLMFNILQSIKIPFCNEFHDSWTESYFYDFMFELNDQKYIIEMDGAFHFRNIPSIGVSAHNASLTDSKKDGLAKCNGFEVIRINCDYTSINERYTYIKNNIINSKLSSIIDLSTIDFDECDRLSQKSDFLRICEMYDNETHDIHKISDMIGISYQGVIEHLKHGEEIGCTTYNHKDALAEREEWRKKKLAKTNSCLLYCVETNEIFDSISSAKCYYGGGIDAYFGGKNPHAGVLDDGTKLHYKKISDVEANNLIQTNNAKFMSIDFKNDNSYRIIRKLKHIVVCNQTNEWFANRAIANKKYHASISRYLSGRFASSGTLDDGTKLTWRVPSIDEINTYINNGGIIIDKVV